ncbi:FAD-dependent oxidoreductase [Microbacterium sp. VKM Ac-2870]|uniref:FAD-dependent oxidoreductase n=1 Tax=Microbacterium sp. VKM Ac-2870 TaxID=2783825 RepID=UPI00188BF5AB|nr:FAD-dependent oxidoreductase [Microbacterium sp. VKM Ac-2870]MBF4561161.1 FAD-dependent oxidoreductase [Microbacterium sp. VKM Ac-2870]
MLTYPSRTSDVLIIGAGPVGLAAALTLRRRGVNVRIVDAAPRGASTSRAAVIHARTLEVLSTIHMATPIVEEGIVVPDFTVRDGTQTLAHLDFRGLQTPYPFTLMLSQARIEEMLAAALAAWGCEVEREVEFDSFAELESTRRAMQLVFRESARHERSFFAADRRPRS